MNKIESLISKFLGVLVTLAVMQPLAARAETPSVQEAEDVPTIEIQHQGQWFREMSNQTGVKYVFIGRGAVSQAYFASKIPISADSKVDLIEIVSSETSSKGRDAIRRFADRLSGTLPLEVVCQTRDEDDGSLVTISVVVKPDNPDIATDILVYKWSKTFEVALIHLKGEFDLNKAIWQLAIMNIGGGETINCIRLKS